jgi:hypothetical protein
MIVKILIAFMLTILMKEAADELEEDIRKSIFG